MLVLFFQAARMALVVFDPYMSSRPLADALLRAPEGKLIVDHHYYTFSSIFFYTNRDSSAAERADQQSGVRVLCSRSARCFHRRFAMDETVAFRGAILFGGDPIRDATPRKTGG